MIVNKYINDLKIEFALSNLDLFIFDKIGSRSEGGGGIRNIILGRNFYTAKLRRIQKNICEKIMILVNFQCFRPLR